MSPASWQSVLDGLVELAAGLGAVLAAGGDDPGVAAGLFPAGSLVALLGGCPGQEGVRGVMSIAAALPFVPGAAEIRIRCVGGLWRVDRQMCDTKLEDIRDTNYGWWCGRQLTDLLDSIAST